MSVCEESDETKSYNLNFSMHVEKRNKEIKISKVQTPKQKRERDKRQTTQTDRQTCQKLLLHQSIVFLFFP